MTAKLSFVSARLSANCDNLNLAPTIPALHSTRSFTEASQISPGRSMRAQLLQDMLQGQGINHPTEQEPWQAQTHIHQPRFTLHIEAQQRNLDPLHQVVFKLVIDLQITK